MHLPRQSPARRSLRSGARVVHGSARSLRVFRIFLHDLGRRLDATAGGGAAIDGCPGFCSRNRGLSVAIARRSVPDRCSSRADGGRANKLRAAPAKHLHAVRTTLPAESAGLWRTAGHSCCEFASGSGRLRDGRAGAFSLSPTVAGRHFLEVIFACRWVEPVRDCGSPGTSPDALAGELGFEPRFSESESDVLPLNYSPKSWIRRSFRCFPPALEVSNSQRILAAVRGNI
jgi:hypothetical protein